MLGIRATALRDGLKLPSQLSIAGGSIFHATWPASRWNRGVLCRHVRAYTAVYFINRQGLGPTLSPRVYTPHGYTRCMLFARTSVNVSLHPFGYISLLFLSPLLDSRRVPLATQRRIPAVTRASRNDAASVRGSSGVSSLRRKRDLQPPTANYCYSESCYERSAFR